MTVWTAFWNAEGSLALQVIFIALELSGIVYLAMRLTRAQREAARLAHEMVERTSQERAAAILEVRRTADQLAERTAQIAEEFKREAIAAAGTHVADVDHKIDTLMTQFDAVGKEQMAKIDDIQAITDDTNKRLKEQGS